MSRKTMRCTRGQTLQVYCSESIPQIIDVERSGVESYIYLNFSSRLDRLRLPATLNPHKKSGPWSSKRAIILSYHQPHLGNSSFSH